MFVFEKINSMDEEVFNSLFDSSIAVMDSGSYNWQLFPNVVTQEDKRAHIRDCIETHINLPEGILFQVREDDRILMYNCGILYGENRHLMWCLGLIGTDVNGSKSFMYSEEYHDAQAKFWTDYDIRSWEMQTAGAGTSLHEHIIKIFDKYDKTGPVEEFNINDGPVEIKEVDLSKNTRYDKDYEMKMKLVTINPLIDLNNTYAAPANTQLEEEKSTYKYLNVQANTDIQNT